ncbi:MAG: hypothetical protein K6C94_02555 [Candidatus Gastranaerophilales bacterium]|nr:hypothetical protein [Candidatus Gastranaerophilales bacterium]
MTVILGVKTQDRADNAIKIQKILTEYGCFIKTRLGLNSVKAEDCPQEALIILNIPLKEKAVIIENRLLDISGTEIQRMEFDF